MKNPHSKGSIITVNSNKPGKLIYSFPIFVILCLSFFLLKYLMPVTSDDYLYVEDYFNAFSGFWEYNSRFGELLFRSSVSVFSPFVWFIFAVFDVILYIGIFTVAFRRFPQPDNLSDLSLMLFPVLLTVLFPFELGNFTINAYWGNYIFSSCLFVFAYYPLTQCLIDNSDFFSNFSLRVIKCYFFLSLLAAWSHELVALMLLGTAFWSWIIFRFFRKQALPEWFYGFIVSSFIGFLLGLVGSLSRINKEKNVNPFNILQVSTDFYLYSCYHIFLILALACLVVFLSKNRKQKIFTVFYSVFYAHELLFLGGIYSVMASIGFYPARAHIFVLIFLFAIILRLMALLLQQLQLYSAKLALVFSITLITFTLTTLLSYTLIVGIPSSRQRSLIEAQVKEQVAHGKTILNVPAEVILTKNCTHHFWGVTNGPLSWIVAYYNKALKPEVPITNIIPAAPLPGFNKDKIIILLDKLCTCSETDSLVLSKLDYVVKHIMARRKQPLNYQLQGNEIKDFNEAVYLKTYKDVADAVKKGYFGSGLEHFIKFGRAEGRLQTREYNKNKVEIKNRKY
jgi:hypothetical protein